MTSLIIACSMWAFTLVNSDGRLVYSPLYRDGDSCQADAHAWASSLEVPETSCYRYDFCFVPQAPLP